MTETKENIKKRIDTNKNQHIENNEIDNFLKNSKSEELNNLWEHINNLPIYNNDELKKALNDFFLSPERNKYDQSIKNKVRNNQPLNKTELSLMYLAMIAEPNKHFTQQQLKFNSNEPIDQICGWTLIRFIRTKYNFPTYTWKKVEIKSPNQTQKKKNTPSVNPMDRMKEAQKIWWSINLPQNIWEIKENDADFYCDRLITRAENNFSNEISKAKRELERKHRYKNDNEKQAYIKYDTLLIAFEKYTEIVWKKHNAIIYQAWYKNEEELETQWKLLEAFEKEMKQKYPNIDTILSKIKEYEKEMENNEKKYFKNKNELKKAEQNNKEFNEYIEKKSKEFNVKELQKSVEKDPKTPKEAEEYFKNLNKIYVFQEDVSEKDKSYWDSITKYQKYVKWAINIQKKQNIQQYNDILNKYNQDITEWNKKINFKKYENYTDLLKQDWKLTNGLKNINTLNNLIINQKSKWILVKEFKWIEKAQQIKQERTDAIREKIKKFDPISYWMLTSFTWLRNWLVDATIWAWTWLGTMILWIIRWKDETLAQMDRKEKRDNFLKIWQSSSQKESVYNSETKSINFNTDNTVSTVASSISQMITLIAWWWALAKWATKAFWIWEKVAWKVWLFSSSFITQVGWSYGEAIKGWLNYGEALWYSMLSATVQSGLELVSPNDVLLWKWSWITKELIKNVCKSWSKESLKMIWKTFTKNVWLEIAEENIQETLQLAAWNLINMAANWTFWSELWADRSWKNFASTAIITTLTTWITTWTSTWLQMNNLSSQDKTKLIEHIKNDKWTYIEVTEMIDKAIAWKVKIPNVEIQALENLKLELNGEINETKKANKNNESQNPKQNKTEEAENNYEKNKYTEIDKISEQLWSKFHEEWRKWRLKKDWTYEPRIKETKDTTWIKKNWTNQVDIANTKFENLPSDWKYENLEAAKVAVNLVYEKLNKWENISNEFIEETSAKVHEERLKRNSRAKWWELDIPYSDLPESEKAKDRNQVLQAIEIIKLRNKSDYFDWKSHKFEVTETQARWNSEMMDNLLNEINKEWIKKWEINKKLKELRKTITKQYEESTWEKLKLSDEQLLSIIDAHEQDWVLWELTIWQLRQKVKTLDETITDSKVRRFLLEAGFCGSILWKLLNKKSESKWDYKIWEIVNVPRSDESITPGGKIQEYNASTWQYFVVRTQNGKRAWKWISNEQLNKVNAVNAIEIWPSQNKHTDVVEHSDIPSLSNEEINYLKNKIPKTWETKLFLNEWLTPKNKINIWNWKILYTTDKIIDKYWRPLLIWYIIEWWQLHLRLFYRSNSEWCWRACPGMREDGAYSKWDFIANSSYETTTKLDPTIWEIFDKLKTVHRWDSPILDTSKKCCDLREMWRINFYWTNILKNEIKTEISVNWKLFRDLPDNAVNFYMHKNYEDVVNSYKKIIPSWLDYEHMTNSGKSYSYNHDYLWKVNVEVYTIKRNWVDLDFHFSRAINSPDKVRIENVVYSDAKINSFWVYDKQINAWPLVAKPVDYNTQCPNTNNNDLMPMVSEIYRDIRGLYQENTIIKKFKKISK